MSERWKQAEGGRWDIEGYECDECGTFVATDPATGRRPRGWYNLVLFHPWFDGQEGEVMGELDYCSRECLNLGRRTLPVLENDDGWWGDGS